jgi:hypothetical protein
MELVRQRTACTSGQLRGRLAAIDLCRTDLTASQVYGAGELEIRGAEPTLACRREANHKIVPAWIVVGDHVVESDVAKAITLDSRGDICLAQSDSLS